MGLTPCFVQILVASSPVEQMSFGKVGQKLFEEKVYVEKIKDTFMTTINVAVKK